MKEKTLTSTNTLPELPKKLNKREAKVTPRVLEWFRQNKTLSSCAIEIKATNKDTIPEKALQPHQRRALLAAKNGGITHKIADNRTRLPFDAFYLKNAGAWVVACFTRYGYCLVFDVDEWNGARFDDDCLFKIDL